MADRNETAQQGSARQGAADVPLHRSIYEQLLREIQSGVYSPGDRLPSEARLCERFSASRITVARAIQGLQRDQLVRRRPGSGTFVQAPSTTTEALRFGLLIPELGTTEIFEPICQGMMQSPLAKSHSLTWGHVATSGSDREAATEALCQQFIAQRVAGVFFSPLEYTPNRDAVNERIVQRLGRAGITMVLLDRCYKRFPERSHLDLVGIDNHRAGAHLTAHLIRSGARRPVFAARANSASTIDARSAGYYTALRSSGLPYVGALDFAAAEDPEAMERLLDREQPDAIICGNDLTAARVMRMLGTLGRSIPEEVRVAGFDDVSYATFLPVPLTTIHQNCAEIGAVAMSAMLARCANPEAATRDLLVDFRLVVRESCGGTGDQRKTRAAAR